MAGEWERETSSKGEPTFDVDFSPLLDGYEDAVKQSFQAIVDQPRESAVYALCMAGVGGSLALLSRAGGIGLAVSRAACLGMSFDLTAKTASNAGTVWHSVSNILSEGGDQAAKRTMVANALRPLIRDFELSLVGGSAGAAAARELGIRYSINRAINGSGVKHLMHNNVVRAEAVSIQPNQTTGFTKFDIPVNPAERLSGTKPQLNPNYKVEDREYRLHNDLVAEKFENANDFYERATYSTSLPSRVYSVDGVDTKIVVPESYAQKLDAVRNFQPGTAKDPLQQRILPEDIIPSLRELPIPHLVKEVRFVDHPNYMDPWTRQTYSPNFFSAASAGSDGNMHFWRTELEPDLRSLVNHEWSHVLRYSHPELRRKYDRATELEQFHLREYAKKNTEEDWAVNTGEGLMHRDGSKFLEVAQQAPLRSTVWSNVMKEALSKAPASQQPQLHPALAARLEHIDQQIAPRANELVRNNFSNRDRLDRLRAIELSAETGIPKDLPKLLSIAIRDAGSVQSDTAALSAARIVERSGGNSDAIFKQYKSWSVTPDSVALFNEYHPNEKVKVQANT